MKKYVSTPLIHQSWLLGLLFITSLLVALSVDAQAGNYTGYLDDDTPPAFYPVNLLAGQTVTVNAERASGYLDTVIHLQDSGGDVLIENDDYGNTLDSFFTYTVTQNDKFAVVISNYPGSAGEYRLSISVDGEQITPGEADNDADLSALPPGETYTGYMGDDVSDDRYPVTLAPGEGVIANADATDGGLDTYLFLQDADGVTVAENDDRDFDSLNSTLVYISETGGEYTLVMSNFPGSRGDYRLSVSVVMGDAVPVIRRASFSGPALMLDTPNFRIHYTLEGRDSVTEAYLDAVAQTLEEVYTTQITDLGWLLPLRDGVVGGDARFDVYLIDLERSQGELGVTVIEPPVGDNPTTLAAEVGAASSYIILDNSYADADDPIQLMRATAAHEFHHAVQFAYDAREPFNWYHEATSTWMETVAMPQDQDAVGYVQDVFTYPEICFGADSNADPTDGFLMYGQWMFIQSLVDVHGPEIIQSLWENIALTDNWQPLEDTLAAYNEALSTAVARYQIQNMMRDYVLTPEFGDISVWLETTITNTGDWTIAGRGIQELGANFYALALPDGTYTARMENADADLRLWFIGITGDTARAVLLGQAGAFASQDYDYAYLMVFNQTYDDDITDCAYATYDINIQRGGTPLEKNVLEFNASQFIPLD